MQEIILKAKTNAQVKPVYDIKVNHQADWRLKTETNTHLRKIDCLYSFAVVKELMQAELDRVVINGQGYLSLGVKLNQVKIT